MADTSSWGSSVEPSGKAASPYPVARASPREAVARTITVRVELTDAREITNGSIRGMGKGSAVTASTRTA
ncbi:MAG TPA: hypothetical protein ENK57_06900 [Polyangiaceae bacterium]|nr:hypothetical protein [Polyangiaceae bacterium]